MRNKVGLVACTLMSSMSVAAFSDTPPVTFASLDYLKKESPSDSSYLGIKKSVEKELESYLSYLYGWDGFNGATPDSHDVAFAQRLLGQLYDKRLPLPLSMMTSEGQVSLVWDTNEIFVDIAIEKPGSLSFYSLDKVTGIEKFGDNVFSDVVPKYLLHFIGKSKSRRHIEKQLISSIVKRPFHNHSVIDGSSEFKDWLATA